MPFISLPLLLTLVLRVLSGLRSVHAQSSVLVQSNATAADTTSTTTSISHTPIHRPDVNYAHRRRQVPPEARSYDYYPRQEPPVLAASTSSYDYWWPYPPDGGVTTSTIISDMAVSPTIVAPSLTMTSTTLTPSAIPVLISLSLAAVPTTASNETFGTTSSTTLSATVPFNTSPTLLSPSFSSNSVTSSSFMNSITHITAIPPSSLPTSAPYHPAVARKPFNKMYLIPLFALLGVGTGIASAWWMFGYVKRRRDAAMLVVSVDGDGDETWKEGDGLEEREETEGEGEIEGSPVSRAGQHYYNRAPATPRGDDPFNTHFSSPARATSTSTKSSFAPFVLSTPVLNAHDSDQSDDFEDVDEYGDDEDGEPIRHTSIRRVLIQRLGFMSPTRAKSKTGSPELERGVGRRRGHVRADSDMRIGGNVVDDDERKREVRRGKSVTFEVEVSESGSPALSRAMSVASGSPPKLYAYYAAADGSPRKTGSGEGRGKGRGLEDVDETEWVEGSGFRMVEDDMEARAEEVKGRERESGKRVKQDKVAHKEGQKRWGGWPLPATMSAPTKQEDKFTPSPVRRLTKSRERGRGNSSSARPTASSSSSRSHSHSHPYSSVLPSSPPRISSPQLESDLLFSVAIQRSDTRDVVVSRDSSPCPSRNTTNTSSPVGRRTDGSRSAPSSSMYQGPSSSIVASNGHLLRVPSKALPSLPPERRTRSDYRNDTQHRSSTSRTDSRPIPIPISRHPSSPAVERYTARRGALDKVEEILTRSYSSVGVNQMPRSPTRFGASVNVNESGAWKAMRGGMQASRSGARLYEGESGIEQRLEGM